MCLAADVRVRKPRKFVGYKVLYSEGDGIYFNQPLGQWVRAINHTEIQGDDMQRTSYPSGFHVFRNIEDARNWRSMRSERIYKVYYRHVVATGKQYNANVGLTDVALEIFVHPEPVE